MRYLKHALTAASAAVLITACGAPDPVASDKQAATETTSQTTLQAVTNPQDANQTYEILVSGTRVGEMKVDRVGLNTKVFYEFRNNGRGPTINEDITFGEDGFPTAWTIKGATTFGNKVDESYTREGDLSTWTDTTGTGTAMTKGGAMYVGQEASPYSSWIYARALLAQPDREMPVLPGGTLRLAEVETLNVTDKSGATIPVTAYALSGINENPYYILLDNDEAFFATMSPRFALVRTGFENEDERLRNLSAEYSARRFEDIQARVAKNFDTPVRINNVRIFDPVTESLTTPKAVIVNGNRISDVIEASAPIAANTTVIDGAGGTLIAGMYEMHGHLGQNSALLNIAAGVTTVRDMGNSNDVLGELDRKIKSGRLAGPRIIRSGFIEGKSPFSSNNGELVSTQEEAVEAVKRYANGEFFQIKIYNSMKGEWVPAMIEEARKHGLRVAGHVPAFSNANQMIAAGYDEMTHINQVMLGWVLEEGEDTRSLLRLTALRRLPALDLSDPRIKETIDAMAANGTAIDPTLAIHEALLRSRNGETQAGVVDYIDNMPVGVQRSAKTAWSDIATPEDDKNYYEAFDKIIETVTAMREAGIMLVPGTDLGGSFSYHRELELYQQVGMTPAEIVAWATQGMADYVGQGDELGSIEAGKLADFFLVAGDPTADLKAIKTISMVVKDGTVYFPSEIYPEFGIKPFVDAPEVIEAE